MTKQEILEILETEDIRLVDGRYSNGFVAPAKLIALVDSGKAEPYKPEECDLTFIRLTKGVK